MLKLTKTAIPICINLHNSHEMFLLKIFRWNAEYLRNPLHRLKPDLWRPFLFKTFQLKPWWIELFLSAFFYNFLLGQRANSSPTEQNSTVTMMSGVMTVTSDVFWWPPPPPTSEIRAAGDAILWPISRKFRMNSIRFNSITSS